MAYHHHESKSATSKVRKPILLALGFFILAERLLADPTGGDPRVERELMRSMMSALRVNLRGRQVEAISSPQNGPTRTTTRTIVRCRDGRSITRCLLPTSMRGAIKQDDGEWTRSFEPQKGTVEISRSMPRIRSEADARRLIHRISANYVIRLAGADWMAGRPCNVLEFLPRDPSGHTVKIWVDKQTGVVLSRQESDSRGGTLALSFFTTATFPARIADSDLACRFQPRYRRDKLALTPIFREISPIRRLAGFEVHQPYAMPGGYHFDSGEIAIVNGVRVACLRYTDGLGVITICQSRSVTAASTGYQCQHLPRGETMVLASRGHTAFMVIGPRDPQGLVPVARALDNDRERELIGQLCRNARVPLKALVSQRNRGIGLDDLAALLEIAYRTHRQFESLVALHRDGWCWTQIAARYQLDPSKLQPVVRTYQVR